MHALHLVKIAIKLKQMHDPSINSEHEELW